VRPGRDPTDKLLSMTLQLLSARDSWSIANNALIATTCFDAGVARAAGIAQTAQTAVGVKNAQSARAVSIAWVVREAVIAQTAQAARTLWVA
jgi:hypothetical protein